MEQRGQLLSVVCNLGDIDRGAKSIVNGTEHYEIVLQT